MTLGLIQVMKSSDTGAPAHTNAAGGLITILNACLINGYNSQTMTSVTSVSTTATVTKNAHGFVLGQVVAISGASPAAYNGNYKITNVTANTFDYTFAGGTSPATGTINAKVAPLGYTSAATAANLAAYLAPSGANQYVLYVDDTNTTANNSELRGYTSALTSITNRTTNNGGTTDCFPTTAQVALGSGPYFYKGNATSRAWQLWSDGKIFHFVLFATGLTYPECGFTFGDFPSLKAGDTFNTMLRASPTSNNAGSTTCGIGGGTSSTAQVWMARSQSGAAGGIAGYVSNIALGTSLSGALSSTTTLAYPNESDQAIYLLTPYIYETSANRSLRGRIPGQWWVLNNISVGTPAVDDTLASAPLEGTSRDLVFLRGPAAATAGWFMETTNTWQS